MANGRCRMHGGGTPRGVGLPQTKHGRYSKDLPTRLAGLFDAALADPSLLELSPDIALTDTMLADVVRRLDTGESGATWRELREAKQALTAARGNAQATRTALTAVLTLIDKGASSEQARAEVVALQDHRRRLAESETRRIQLARGTMNEGEAMLLVSALVNAVRRQVRDRDVLAGIESEFARILGGGVTPEALPVAE